MAGSSALSRHAPGKPDNWVIDLTEDSDDEVAEIDPWTLPSFKPAIKREQSEQPVKVVDPSSAVPTEPVDEFEVFKNSECHTDDTSIPSEQASKHELAPGDGNDGNTAESSVKPDLPGQDNSYATTTQSQQGNDPNQNCDIATPAEHIFDRVAPASGEDNTAHTTQAFENDWLVLDNEDATTSEQQPGAGQLVVNNDVTTASEQPSGDSLVIQEAPDALTNQQCFGPGISVLNNEDAPAVDEMFEFDPSTIPEDTSTDHEQPTEFELPVLNDVHIEDFAALQAFTENSANFDGDVDLGNEEDAAEPAPLPAGGSQPVNGDVEMLDWNNELDENYKTANEENENKKAAFACLKKEFERKKSRDEVTQEEEIRFAAAEAAEQARLRDFERSQMEVEEAVEASNLPLGYEEEDTLFIPEVPDLPEHPQPKKRAGPKPKNRINAKELREAMSAGLEAGQANGKKPKRKTQNDGGQPRKRRQNPGPKKQPNKRGRKGGSKPNLTNLQSLGRTNVVDAARANADRPDMPTFTSKDKSKALNELIASIPTADQNSHSSERNAILEATKKFKGGGRGAVRSDGQGGWKLRGMESSLYHHQLLGAAFLCDRERSDAKPFGGMVCDEMGFGKTIQMIANMLEGKPDEGSPFKTTLIVAPPSLVHQWMVEMDKHVKDNALGRILRYHRDSRLISNDVVSDLQAYDVIVTTYGEVQRSYPMTDPPKHLSSEVKKNEWWKNFYLEHCGPLHKIKFHRIVLDEAHAIKNHTSKTSVAVRALTGTFRWAITGTPIMNYIEELYPYFSFLKVPHTGDYPTFCHNYCDNRSTREPVDMGRIHNILRAIMLRRTHVDSLFNAPIVKLPGISHTTHLVEFNSVERAIYNLVKRRYIHQINSYSASGELTANYRNVLSMLLRLRMLCSHIFLCQEALKQMFVAADIETLWRVTSKEVETADQDAPRVSTLVALRKMLQAKDNTIMTCQTKEGVQSVAATPEADTNDDLSTGAAFALTFKFRRFLRTLTESNTWAELHVRSMCAKCRLPPDEPMCTSCFHVYCKECLAAMDFERQQREEEKIACIECGAHFEETSPCSGLQELGFNSNEVAQRVEKLKTKRSKAAKNKSSTAAVRRGSASHSQTPAGEDDDELNEPPDWIEHGQVLSSAKLTATKAAILNWQEKNPREKIIIYTQFLGLCRILARMCDTEKWGYVSFNGKMTLEAREKAIENFRDKESISIMICSLRAGGIGLNLTMASKVIILDLWFNSSVEAQAYCRAFRIGQDKKVEVVRFAVKDSIDEDLIKMQDRKDVEVSGAIGPDSHGKRATIQQLLELFGSVQEEDDGQNEFILMEDEGESDDDENVDMSERLPPRPF
ncbi:hypothetical protein LTR99_004787 [Exophiala xenobiotica]|uniref:Uncharacterized protein n=1 Tax=Vermiconidia calcicola TaxID=1690605 RepID=A0AAV9QGK9_9PEZI|nr:hypothetical protein LTR96_001106 [Exophiala xenobiotica]KAK5540068.1 hypothetical protein LTR25_003773 [Vermiconidia calcicola]KAK5543158.1 hypothetical protein LTR23_004921 [Chaetothyriales sp. CCFEE 6169]KAK5304331.1 hypothetical protein LTR99_004787 [Exophiala xenobiotica]KAK5338940.1 hypothetical protein LTR98_005340 [Exophiala xenobiotica]